MFGTCFFEYRAKASGTSCPASATSFLGWASHHIEFSALCNFASFKHEQHATQLSQMLQNLSQDHRILSEICWLGPI